MTAALFDEVVAVAPARNLHVVRDTTPTEAPAPKKVTRRADALPLIGHDPMVDGIALLLTVPVRHAYAALLRVGLLEVRA
jgi:hypothetical protein